MHDDPGPGAGPLEGSRQFQLLVESIPDTVVLLDEQNVIRYANRRLAEIFGYEPDQAVGQPLSLLQPERLQAAHRDGLKQLVSGALPSRDWQAFETEARRRDGTEFPVEIAFSELRIGGQRYFAGFIRDVTHRRRERQRLARAERRLESILNAMRDCVWSATTEGRLLYVNQAAERISGRPLKAFSENPLLWLELTHPDDRDKAVALTEHTLARGAAAAEYRIVRPDGELRHLRVEARAIRNAQGEVVRLDGLVSDVTEARAHERRILRLSRMHAVLSGINSLTVRERNRQRLFEGACRIAVEQGQLRLAWVGVTGARGAVSRVAVHGHDEGYTAAIAEYLSADRPQSGPAVRALKERRAIVINDLLAEPTFAPVHAAAAARGLRAVASLPLTVHSEAVACINLYAAEAGFFDEEELGVLQQLANDLSYALEFITREEQLSYAASFDAVTGLANRQLFLQRLTQFMSLSRARERRLAVLMFDLARFKWINDVFGHAAGDEVLKQVAERLQRFAGDADYVARVGGDRFAAAVPDLRDAAELTRVLQDRVWARLGRPLTIGGHELRLTARVGAALYPDDGDEAAVLLRNAEAALKRAKDRGERVRLYTPEMTAVVTQKLALEGQLRQALEQNQFVLHYQPKVNLQTGRVCGAEALIRWNSPRGLVAPADFLPVLEETGLIVDAGRWVLERAGQDLRQWERDGIPPLPVAVNVSPQQLREDDFEECVHKATRDVDGVSAPLELEVTESTLMSHMDPMVEKLRRLRERGVSTAIDDFGTGYSSLAYLARLPVNAVKVDRSFVLTMTENRDTKAIVSAIVALAHSMNLKVVAEGVESDQHVEFLRRLSCDEMQGYLFSRPLPKEEFLALLRSGRSLA